MANVHILEAGPSRMRVVLHIPVPATNNGVGTPWRTALVNSGIGGTTSLKDGDGTAGTITATEKANILSGALYEVHLTEKLRALSAANLDDLFNMRRSEILTELQERLRFYGATR